MEFVSFSSNIPGGRYSAKAEEDAGVAQLVRDAHAVCLAKMFDYAPLKTEEIKKIVKPANDADSLISSIESLKPSQLEAQLRSAVTLIRNADDPLAKKLGDPIDFAVAYYLHLLSSKIYPLKLAEKGKVEKNEVRFAANYRGWMLVKKVNLDIAQRKEVLAALAGMNASLERKAAELTEGFDVFDAELEKSLSAFPERKSFAKIPILLKTIQPQLSHPVFGAYAFSRAMARLGYAPCVTIQNINDNYPELKIPKPKGNFGKKKK